MADNNTNNAHVSSLLEEMSVWLNIQESSVASIADDTAETKQAVSTQSSLVEKMLAQMLTLRVQLECNSNRIDDLEAAIGRLEHKIGNNQLSFVI